MLWLEYLTQTYEIFTQKTGAHLLFESCFRIVFVLLEAECHRFLISNLAWYTLYFNENKFNSDSLMKVSGRSIHWLLFFVLKMEKKSKVRNARFRALKPNGRTDGPTKRRTNTRIQLVIESRLRITNEFALNRNIHEGHQPVGKNETAPVSIFLRRIDGPKIFDSKFSKWKKRRKKMKGKKCDKHEIKMHEWSSMVESYISISVGNFISDSLPPVLKREEPIYLQMIYGLKEGRT